MVLGWGDPFQSTPASRDAGDRGIGPCRTCPSVFQSTPASRDAGDVATGGDSGQVSVFQSTPASRDAGDVSGPLTGTAVARFNPLPRRVTRETGDPSRWRGDPRVSIHSRVA